jgi:ubiquinone/menaquinone biosynthesis C-methylase UbiE/uncharacterized protein YbaR (Trm112 family)
MDGAQLDLVCPACRSDLRATDAALLCTGCARSYPVLLGIPDLRLWPDPYISLEEDRAKALRLAEECRDLDFADSIELYYRVTAAVPAFQARRFARSLLAAVGRSAALLPRLAEDRQDGYPLLDVGCGTAPFIAAAAAAGVPVVGVDVAFRWLVMAQKRLAERGVAAQLVCACAEALPFRTASVGGIVAESTLEHLRDQALALRECSRVLRPGARLLLSTPNRHSIGPDPHTGLPAGSWLPAAWTAAYVTRKGGVPPRRSLLTQRQLRRALDDAGFVDVDIVAPEIPASQRAAFGRLTRLGIDAYHLVRRAPGGSAAIRALGPMLQASARNASRP